MSDEEQAQWTEDQIMAQFAEGLDSGDWMDHDGEHDEWDPDMWGEEMQDWEHEMEHDWEQGKEDGQQMNLEGDWFGDLVNDPCAPECEV
jgi:hypothetical protein